MRCHLGGDLTKRRWQRTGLESSARRDPRDTLSNAWQGAQGLRSTAAKQRLSRLCGTSH
jgi:hypothetical protein